MRKITLTIPYALSVEQDQRLNDVYAAMPGWIGLDDDGCPQWFGKDGSEYFLWASMEPSGLLVSGRLPDAEWETWTEELTARATEALGIPVGDAEV